MSTENTIFLARQPIVDAQAELVGFELLFRGSADARTADVTDNVFATSTVVANVFTEFGLAQVIGSVDGFLNVDAEFLFSDLVESLPASQIVLELLETTFIDERVLERVREMRAMGYRVAIDDFVGNFDQFDLLLPFVDMVKIDFEAIDPLLVPMIVSMLGKHDVRLLAEKIETPAQFTQARNLGIGLFQGFHFAHPEILSARRDKPAKFALLRLLALALDESETTDIEEELKHHPALSVNLLRLVNSAAFGSRREITSLRHALVLLGRRQLRIWLQLLLYTADRGKGSMNNPLLQLAATRGKLLEQLAMRQPGSGAAMKDMGFMTGMLSLMDALLGMPLAEVLAEINVPKLVEAALLRREGELGLLLVLVEQLEQDDLSAVAKSLARTAAEVGPRELMPMQLAAYRWANELAAGT